MVAVAHSSKLKHKQPEPANLDITDLPRKYFFNFRNTFSYGYFLLTYILKQ